MTTSIGTNGLIEQYDYQVLTTGFSYTFAAGPTVLVINPAGTLATGTITMPASPADGMMISISSTQAITALTINGNTGQSIVGKPTTLIAGGAVTFVYRLANTTWYTKGNTAAVAVITASQTFTGGQRGVVTALTSTSNSIAIDLAVNNYFSHTTSENTTLAAPSNPVAGQSGVITFTQGATARTLAYNTFWKFAGGTVPTLTATVGAVDILAYYVESATRCTCQLIKDVK